MAKAVNLVSDMVKIVFAQVVESAANTLTFAQISTGYGAVDKIGWIIERIEWHPSARHLMNGSGDYVLYGLTTSNGWSTFAPGEASIKTWHKSERLDLGTAATGLIVESPTIDSWSDLTGGGIIVLPYPLYVFALGYGLSGASTIQARVYFRETVLDDKQWMFLVEQTRLMS